MTTDKPVRDVFEETVFSIVPDILGEDCPTPEALRSPRWRGRRFYGLTHDPRERIKAAPGMNVPPLFKTGLWFLARFHLARELKDFEGSFSAYVPLHLHEALKPFRAEVETVAAVYDVPLSKIEQLAGIYTASYRIEERGLLQWDLAKAIRLNKTDKLIAHFERIAETEGSYVRCNFR